MKWKTRITELFGCKYPILEGAYAAFGSWEFAAAISRTGALGMITAGTSKTPEKLREDLKKFRDATDKPFGVNLSIPVCPQIDKMLEVCLEEEVNIIETAGYKPDALAPRIEESGVKWIHKAARVKDAVHAEQLGADAIIIVGLEGAGHKSPEQLPTMLNTIWAKRELKIPFIAAGGICDARSFLGALGMGADAVMMGTAFMLTKECPITDSVKQAMLETTPADTELRQLVLTPADPRLYADVMKLRGTMPEQEWLRKLASVRPGSSASQDAPPRRTPGGGSFAMAFIDSIPSVKELIDSIIGGAEELIDSYQFLKTM